jgi:hypothetical protein
MGTLATVGKLRGFIRHDRLRRFGLRDALARTRMHPSRYRSMTGEETPLERLLEQATLAQPPLPSLIGILLLAAAVVATIYISRH